jgi:hypothetical protein
MPGDAEELATERKAETIPDFDWSDVKISETGHLQVGNDKPTLGSLNKGYRYFIITGRKFSADRICAIAYGILTKDNKNFDVDHITPGEESKGDNSIGNLQVLDRSEHNKKTSATTDLNAHAAIMRAGVVTCTGSTDESIVKIGTRRTTYEFGLKIGSGSAKITACANNNKNNPGEPYRMHHGDFSASFVWDKSPIEDQLIKGDVNEEIVPGKVKIDGVKYPFEMTTFGRFVNRALNKIQFFPTGVKIEGKKKLIHELMLLTKKYKGKVIFEPPFEPKKKKIPQTVNHIDGREGQFPHRLENLEWATKAEQIKQRKPR